MLEENMNDELNGSRRTESGRVGIYQLIYRVVL